MDIKMAGNDQAELPLGETAVAPDDLVGDAAVVVGHRLLGRRVDEPVFYVHVGEHDRLKQA
jgi:hypothetical protein